MKVVTVIFVTLNAVISAVINDDLNCDKILPPDIIAEINSYKAVANRIIGEVLNGQFKGSSYDELSTFVDTFGHRLSGTENLENSINYMLKKLKQLGLDNVHGEELMVPHWVRGEESAAMIEPRFQKLNMLGLGSSVGTPPGGITEEVVVFDSFEDMEQNGTLVPGNIVVFNQKFESYGKTVVYRSTSASKASRLGAKAVLVSSITPYSIDSPHTGHQSYDADVKPIPVACITPAAAHMLGRMYKRGDKVVVKLNMEATNLPDTVSRNTIADLKGTNMPAQLVIVSGHLDSWDVGVGAMDDGAGAFISWNALAILKKLELRAKRTIRAILWTAEEPGLVGAFAYLHKHNISNINFAMESDEGTFRPYGFAFSGTDKAACIVQQTLQLLSSISVSSMQRDTGVGSDISLFTQVGVPGASLLTEASRYFWFHHSEGDTMDVENSDELDLCTAAWAVLSYVIADLSIDMPRELNISKLEAFRRHL